MEKTKTIKIPISLSSSPAGEKTEPKTTEVEKPAEVPVEEKEIKILNATKKAGLAGKLKIYLEENKFTKVEAGNSEGTYKGATIYYAADQAEAAEQLKEILVIKYPKMTIRAADEKIAETGSAPLVVIIGN